MNSHNSILKITKFLILACGTVFVLLVSGCSGSSDNGIDFAGIGEIEEIEDNEEPVNKLAGCADDDSCFSNPVLEIGADRPAQVQIPSDYNTSTRYPLIIVLHGFGANGALQTAYFRLDTRVDSQQYVLVAPDGIMNESGDRFWNATPGCCAFLDEAAQDDVAYIRSLIEEAAATYSIDVGRIGLIGHSNGGFMALRMACEASDLVTSVVSLAGSTFENAESCAPATNPVSVLALHGDDDETISYDGGENSGESYPGALETIERFAGHAGCDTANPLMPTNIDVIGGNLEGAETTVLAYPDCAGGAEVELWTLVGAPHIPFPWVESAQDSYVDWLISHNRE